MEMSSLETSLSSDWEEPAWWEASAFNNHPGGDMGAPSSAATKPLTEENDLRVLPDKSWIAIMQSCFSEISAKTSPSSALSFLVRLWKTAGSRHFKSIWWADDGNCIVIAEKLFRKEVLGRSGPQKIFETKSMAGFILQLNLHGFCKMEGDSLITTSIEELQELAEAGSGLGKLFFYYNPFFKRDYPNLLKMFTESAGDRERAPSVFALGPRMRRNCKRKQQPIAQSAEGASGEENSTQTSTATSSTREPGADTNTQTDIPGPSAPKQHSTHSPACVQEVAPAPSTASPYHETLSPQTVI